MLTKRSLQRFMMEAAEPSARILYAAISYVQSEEAKFMLRADLFRYSTARINEAMAPTNVQGNSKCVL